MPQSPSNLATVDRGLNRPTQPPRPKLLDPLRQALRSLMYGADLRLMECLRLRVQDSDSRRLCYADPHKVP